MEATSWEEVKSRRHGGQLFEENGVPSLPCMEGCLESHGNQKIYSLSARISNLWGTDDINLRRVYPKLFSRKFVCPKKVKSTNQRCSMIHGTIEPRSWGQGIVPFIFSISHFTQDATLPGRLKTKSAHDPSRDPC